MNLQLDSGVTNLLSKLDINNPLEYLNAQLHIHLKNRLKFGKATLNLRIPQNLAEKIEFMRNELEVGFTAVIFLAINEMYENLINEIAEDTTE